MHAKVNWTLGFAFDYKVKFLIIEGFLNARAPDSHDI